MSVLMVLVSRTARRYSEGSLTIAISVARKTLVSGVASAHRLISTHQIFFGRVDYWFVEQNVCRFL